MCTVFLRRLVVVIVGSVEYERGHRRHLLQRTLQPVQARSIIDAFVPPPQSCSTAERTYPSGSDSVVIV